MTAGKRAAYVACLLAFCGLAGPAWAGRFIVDEENDTFASYNDRDYTQGLRFAWLGSPLGPDGKDALNKPYDWLESAAGVMRHDAGDRQRRVEWSVGQSIFTPEDLTRPNPDPLDHPYAGWFFVGANFLQESDKHILENFDVLVGVVGPAAFGRTAQNRWHQYIGVDTAQGWAHQLRNEPAFMVSYEKRWRMGTPVGSELAADFIPELGITAGTVMTYADAGAIFRFGHGLDADYGPPHIRPGVSGTGWFDWTHFDKGGTFGPLDWYMFVGAQVRAVARNIFLDGSTFASGPSVSRRVAVADLVGGVSVMAGYDIKLDFSVTRRTKEFGRQHGPDTFGLVTISIGH